MGRGWFWPIALAAGLLLLSAGVCRRLAGRVIPTAVSIVTETSVPETGISPPSATRPPAAASSTPEEQVRPFQVEPMTLRTVSQADSRQALCNDGAPAQYYYRRGQGNASRSWVIHLQGGGFCNSAASCVDRKRELPELMTSNRLPNTRAGEGIESTSSDLTPDFYSANHVYVHYCSSDLWSGSRGASADTGGLHFRGTQILRSVIEDLSDPALTPSPNLTDATRVLFSGSSAGGAGVLVHLDWLAQQLPNASVRGVDDAGWFVNIAPYDLSLETTLQTVERGYDFWNGSVDASCAAANPGSEGRCYLGELVYPYLSTPLFVQISQLDGPQLGALGVSLPLDEQERRYISEFGAAVRASLDPVGAAFSPAKTGHGILVDREFWSLAINGVSLREALGNWFFGRAGPTKLIDQ